MTSSDRTSLLTRQPSSLAFREGAGASGAPAIEIDEAQRFQSIEGFGFALTGGSARLIHQMPADKRAALLEELFGRGPNALSISYLRLSIGASDLSDEPFTYDDIAEGEEDEALARFSIERERDHLLPLLAEIVRVNPHLRFLATPWTAPPWMKTQHRFPGGSLAIERQAVYARYFVKYVAAMQAEGVPIDAVTPQNEPLNYLNEPSMLMDAETQRDFVRDHLGPAFRDANLPTKIIVFDHNCDRPDYPLTILDDPKAKSFVEGSAFHLYAGAIDALSVVHDAHPDKGVYFTEQWTSSEGAFDADLRWHTANVVIGATRNWARTSFEWNLASDPSFDPHTRGGCTKCRGALTIGIGAEVERNVSYYVVGHVSKFVPPGSVRIASSEAPGLRSVAFRTLAGNTVLVVLNEGTATSLTVRVKESDTTKSATTTLEGGSVATYVW